MKTRHEIFLEQQRAFIERQKQFQKDQQEFRKLLQYTRSLHESIRCDRELRNDPDRNQRNDEDEYMSIIENFEDSGRLIRSYTDGGNEVIN